MPGDEGKLIRRDRGDVRAPLVALKLCGRDGTEVEIPLDALLRSLTINAQRTAGRTFKCLNCGRRLPWSGDPETDHHTAQRHKVEDCGHSVGAAHEQRLLLEDFRTQPAIALLPAPRRKKFWGF